MTAISGGGSLATKGAKFTTGSSKYLKGLITSPKTSTKSMLDNATSKVDNIPELRAKVARCKILGTGCFVKDTPVLIVLNQTNFDDSQNGGPQATFERDMPEQKNFNLKQGAKAMAVEATMPIVAVPIQEVQLLDYAVAHKTVNAGYGLTANTDDDIYLGLMDKDPYTSDQQRERDQYQLDDENWNEVIFEEVYGSSTAKLALHNDWINQRAYQVDAVVEMNLPEQGISGPFRITSIKHILPQKKPKENKLILDFAFQPITAIFTHISNDVWNITFDNGDTLGVTYQHPVYSVTAGDWKFAGELQVGDRVLTYAGGATVIALEKKEGEETVYNLEVKDLHNFLVTESGIVVHNSGLCSFLKSFSSKFITWRKAEPDWGLDGNKVNNLMTALKNNDPHVYSTPIYTTTHKGQTYIVNGHHRLKAAKRLKNEQGIDVELQHYDIDPNQIHTIEGGRFPTIQDLINQSFGPNE